MARKSKKDRLQQAPEPALDENLKSKSAGTTTVRWYQRTFRLGLMSAILFWVSLDPIGAWPLAWIAFLPLAILVIRKDAVRGKKDVINLWLAGIIHWLLLVYFVMLPHWAGIFGWLVMGLYFGIYFPLFVVLGRSLVHGFRIPAVVAIPIAWGTCELIRAYLFTGLGVAQLSHAFYQVPLLIQTSDLIGGIGTSMLWMVITTCSAEVFLSRTRNEPFPVIRLATAICVGGFIVVYGFLRLSQISLPSEKDLTNTQRLRVALIQGSIDTEFPATVEEKEKFYENQFQHYRKLTVQARMENDHLDLIVWPESIFPMPHFIRKEGPKTPNEERDLDQRAAQFAGMHSVVQGAGRMMNEDDSVVKFEKSLPMMTGVGTYDLSDQTGFNSVVMVAENGAVTHRYDKNHLVMFGEYFPFGKYMPWVYKLMPISDGLQQGEKAEMIEVKNVKFAPNVCFESTVGHVIRRQLNELGANDQEPDYFANITNDGWFFGTNCLDLHFSSNLFRAVELRKPVVITANTGFSGHIDAAGRILAKGPRREAGVLVVDLYPQPTRFSLYRVVGDWPLIAMTALVLCAWVFDFWRRRKSRWSAS